jgi:hypothetical protein
MRLAQRFSTRCTAGRPFGGALLACALVLAAAAPGLASAPSGRDVTTSEVRLLRQSGDRTTDGGPRAYTLTVAVSSRTESSEPFRAEGVVDLATGATVASFEVTDVPDLADATLDVRAADRSLTYVRSKVLVLPPGKEWVAVPTDQLPQPGTSTSTLDLIEDFVGKPRFVGTDEQHDVHTRHFVVDLRLRSVLEADGPLDAKLERQLRKLEKRGSALVPLNLWIDDDGRIRAMTLYVALTQQLGGPSIETRTEYFDFGAPLDPTPPPADTVVPYDTVADQLAPYLHSSGSEPS